jgi:membrane protein
MDQEPVSAPPPAPHPVEAEAGEAGEVGGSGSRTHGAGGSGEAPAAGEAGEGPASGSAPRRGPDHGPFYEPWLDADRNYSAGAPPTSHAGAALEVERRVLGASRRLDRAQSRFAPVAFTYAVFKKYADDEGSRLAALLAYYTFLSIFPLLIGGFAVLNRILVSQPELVVDLVEEVVPARLQEQVIEAYQSMPSSGPAFTLAVVGLLLSGTGCIFSFYAMVNQVFSVPYRHRYGFGPRYGRVLLLVLLMGIGVLIVAAGSAFLATVSDIPGVERVTGFVLVWFVAFALLYAGASILTHRRLDFSEIALGAALGGVAMTLLLSLGALVVGRFVSTSGAVYGVFASVVGIISVLFLVSNAIVVSFEISIVRAWQLWPRGVDINLLFPADERAYALLTLMDERMPSQRNGVAFDATGHDDPRRSDPDTLKRRAPGVPKRPYDLD